MKILSFDTNTNTMYVTISKNSTIEDYKILKSTENTYNSALLVPTIIELLQKQELKAQDIDAIGVNVGPGSFTGLRASVTVARTMGQQLNIPTVGVSSLQIYSLINTTSKKSLCLLDARRGKAYMAVYDNSGNAIKLPQVIEYDKAIEYAQSEDFFIITDEKMHTQLNNAGINSVDLQMANDDFGVHLATLTAQYLQKDKSAHNWQDLKPLYIQPPPISTPKAKTSC